MELNNLNTHSSNLNNLNTNSTNSSNLNNLDHILVFGPTNSGKTKFVEHLFSLYCKEEPEAHISTHFIVIKPIKHHSTLGIQQVKSEYLNKGVTHIFHDTTTETIQKMDEIALKNKGITWAFFDDYLSAQLNNAATLSNQIKTVISNFRHSGIKVVCTAQDRTQIRSIISNVAHIAISSRITDFRLIKEMIPSLSNDLLRTIQKAPKPEYSFMMIDVSKMVFQIEKARVNEVKVMEKEIPVDTGCVELVNQLFDVNACERLHTNDALGINIFKCREDYVTWFIDKNQVIHTIHPYDAITEQVQQKALKSGSENKYLKVVDYKNHSYIVDSPLYGYTFTVTKSLDQSEPIKEISSNQSPYISSGAPSTLTTHTDCRKQYMNSSHIIDNSTTSVVNEQCVKVRTEVVKYEENIKNMNHTIRYTLEKDISECCKNMKTYEDIGALASRISLYASIVSPDNKSLQITPRQINEKSIVSIVKWFRSKSGLHHTPIPAIPTIGDNAVSLVGDVIQNGFVKTTIQNKQLSLLGIEYFRKLLQN